ncbi:MAG: hypothetical protein ACR2GZ_12165 [Solirubrobacteraceae bacterium]
MLVIAVTAGFAVAGIVSAHVVQKPTLQVAPHASVTDQARKTTVEGIVVNGRGRAVYELSGDSARHPECTKPLGCFDIWPPVTVPTVKRLHQAPGISGQLGTWRRNGFIQVTLNGHPLYTFFRDLHARAATGEAITSFGGIWHVLPRKSTSPSSGTPTSTSSTSSSTTSTTPCLYPPCH